MATKKTDVATVDATPAYLQELEKKGAARQEDNFDSSDVVIPRIKLLQGISNELETHDNAKSGHFWHTGFDEDLGEEVSFVVCSRKKKYLLVTPMDDGQGVLARAEDAETWDKTGKWDVVLSKKHKLNAVWEIKDTNVAKSGLANWGTSNPGDDDSPPAATLFYEYVVLVAGRPDLGPAVISLARSSVKPAKKGLNDKIVLQGNVGRPMQSLVFRARKVDDKNDSGQDFNNWSFAMNGFAPQDLYEMACSVRDTLGDYKVQDEEGAVQDSQGGTNENSHQDKNF